MQLRYQTKLTSSEYIEQEAWKNSPIMTCPVHFHSRGQCSFRRHGTYQRKYPDGLKIQRWYCQEAHQTFSQLPDFAACRASGELKDIENVAVLFGDERARGATVEQAARTIRPDISPQSAMRWVSRRCTWMLTALTLLAGIAPESGAACGKSIKELRAFFDIPVLLVNMRQIENSILQRAMPPLGFKPPYRHHVFSKLPMQQSMGADKPP